MNDSFNLILSNREIIVRIIAAILVGGIIGYERGVHNRPAGFRTHILVCLGACIVSMIQDQLRVNIINFAILYPDISQVIKTDLGRIGAQVVSGIGFLGAGTIMRDKGTVGGLTTAASIWATGCLGIGIGWGFYSLAIPAGIAIIVVLVTLKQLERSLINKQYVLDVEVVFTNKSSISMCSVNIYDILRTMDIKIKNIQKIENERRIIYSLIVPKQLNYLDLISKISCYDFVESVNIK
ncbi:MAG: MgtC/SapB family protein [Fusobacterium perfoetens]|uniref:MgtC/SapB family protein n=1 Tax=Fusobacterium perfoetens TaxID=852 RepID=UPI0023F1CE50|nr:MgtC/SapB family protein [Fusobacterium perfoetens]MCI6152822.1 MgtC/SapB family protein [Fusobacterium perfoetens]MDY3237232.1 MgtC/SapB family protein [Fusobacterium perfoetens]